MDIYVVQEGDTIDVIANKYGISVNQLIIDNGLDNYGDLVPGQTIVIAYPSQVYIVQEGDTLSSIAKSFGISFMQLLRNNPVLNNREYIYPGETLIISYNTARELTTNGFAYPYINKNILLNTLPYLTFLSVFNYRITEKGEIITFSDISEIVQLAKTYSTVPLLMVSTLSLLGEPNLEVVNNILLNEEYQEYMINELMKILEKDGFQGINMIISSINRENQNLYINIFTKISNRFQEQGYLLFVTINPNIKQEDGNIIFDKIDYSSISQLVYRLTFLQYYWGVNTGPPSPVTSMSDLRAFMDYIITEVATDNISIGIPLAAYDWALPYKPNISTANFLTINSAITLAGDVESQFQFDEPSQTPYFYYNRSFVGELIEHVVWSIDARSIKGMNDLIMDYNLIGSGIWNMMVYYQQMWTMIISMFDIVKLIPDDLQ